MSCPRARDIDITSFLAEPRAEEHREFREHYPTCRECSEMVAGWSSLEGALGEALGTAPHPTDELLLAYRRAPEGLAAPEREEVSRHLASCAPCRDALGAVVGLDLERLLAEPAEPHRAAGAGVWSQLADGLRGLFELPAPAWAAVAVVVLLLAIGLPRLLGEEESPAELVASEVSPPPTPEPAPPAPEEEPRIAEAPLPPAEGPEQQLAPEPPAEVQVVEVAPPRETADPVPATEEPSAPAPPEKPPAAKPPATSATLIAALGPEPVRFLPRVGLPAGRIGGGRRGATVGQARPLALAPQTVGLTLERQPSLYWFLPASSASGMRIDVNDLDAAKTVLSTTVRGPLRAGVHVLRLGAKGVRLTTDHNYQWLLTPVGADAPASGGIVRRVGSDAELRAALAQGTPGQRLRVLAAAGVWHDALDLLSRSIAARPADAQLRRTRADLLEQQGLSEAAAWDRVAR